MPTFLYRPGPFRMVAVPTLVRLMLLATLIGLLLSWTGRERLALGRLIARSFRPFRTR